MADKATQEPAKKPTKTTKRKQSADQKRKEESEHLCSNKRRAVSESGEEFTILLRFSCRAPRGVVVLHCYSSSTRLSAILRKHVTSDSVLSPYIPKIIDTGNDYF